MEDPHNAAQNTMKAYPSLSRESLIPVTLVKQAAICFRLDVLEQRLAKLRERILRVSSRNVSKIGARHAWLRTIINHARTPKQVGDVIYKNMQSAVVRKHGAVWNRMSKARKVGYAHDAHILRLGKHAANQEVKAKLKEQETSLIKTIEQNKNENGSFDLLGRCRLSESALAEYDALFDSGLYTNTYVAERRAKDVLLVKPPPDPELATLNLMKVCV